MAGVRWVAVVLALVTGLAGCGGTGTTRWSPTAGSGPLSQEQFSTTVRAAMLAAGTVRATMRTPSGVTTGLLRLGDEPAMRVTSGLGLDREETVLVDDRLYVRSGVGRFHQLDETEAERAESESATGLVIRLLTDNEQGLRRFRHIGEELVDNRPYERYDLVFEPTWLEETFESDRSLPLMNFRFWTDEEHRVRRLLVVMHREEYVVDFSGWGQQVTIAAPAATELLPTGTYRPLTTSTFAEETAAAEAGRVTYRFDMVDSIGTEIHADVVGEGDRVLAIDGMFTSEGFTTEVRYVDRTSFVRRPGDRTWVQLTGEDAEALVRDMESSFSLGAGLRSAIERLDYEGRDEIGGVSFHRYGIEVRREWVAQTMGVSPDDAPEFRYRVHLDEKHRVRRAVYFVGDQTGRYDITRWGAPVEVKRPPAHLIEGRDGA